MPFLPLEKLDLLMGGAVRERFRIALAEVLANIRDPNTRATEKRTITLTLTLAPYATRATAESLRRAAHIRPGDRLRAHGRACTVIGTGPHFFTVAFDRTGARECYAYHAILQKELRRVRNV